MQMGVGNPLKIFFQENPPSFAIYMKVFVISIALLFWTFWHIPDIREIYIFRFIPVYSGPKFFPAAAYLTATAKIVPI